MMTVAAFDFDGTLTRRDTLLPFILNVIGIKGFAKALFLAFPSLLLYSVGALSNERAKEQLVKHALAGRCRASLRHRIARWLPSVAMNLATLEKLKWHQEAGHYCVLISASLNVYLEEFAQRLGFDALICTGLEEDEYGVLTGKFSTPNCWGAEKVRRLSKEIGILSNVELYAYGDSRGDAELLESAQYAWLKGEKIK
ncbi:HAD-IB family hydrolase [Jeongeupia chitinilytica]|uniref:Hydrolase n=1 Tax=Jeongeupia chitinilytica TaxID=1041641 RepID=A0ABQ3H4P1_9NEIS|nr:HAD-IB family hydrolase [Jeongeupia chitinilytica]GHD67422.1 hydrolase [Jeongeupia chitinilytica]